MLATQKSFKTTVASDERGRVFVPVPFDPSKVWGDKPRHHATGTVNGMNIRGPLQHFGEVYGMPLGPAWRRDCGIDAGDSVSVELKPEGPQRDDLAPDVAAALESRPKAGEFFDSLAQFYRRGYLRWIDSTKRSPELRAERIAKMVKLLEKGIKERPQPARKARG